MKNVTTMCPLALLLTSVLVCGMGFALQAKASPLYSENPPEVYGEDGTLLTPTFSGLTRMTLRNEGLRGRGSDVAIVASASGDVTDPLFTDPRDKLMATGQFSSVTVIHAGIETPLDLAAFDAVLVWSNFDFADPAALGDELADYVDAGGGVVLAVFANTSDHPARHLQGRWETDDYSVITPKNGNLAGTASLGTLHLPDHALNTGVSSFWGGLSSYRPASTDLHPGAVLATGWNDGQPLVTFREDLAGRRVDLGFYPPSSDVFSFLWEASTDGDKLMANALTWATGEQYIDVAVAAIPLLAPSTVDITEDPYSLDGQMPGLHCGDTFVLELWVTDSGDLNTGIVAIYLDLVFDNFKVWADNLVHTPLFPDVGPPLTDGTIDNPSGMVVNFGSFTFNPQGIEPEWARLGYIEMSVLGEGDSTITPSLGIGGIGVSGREPPEESQIDFAPAVFSDIVLGDWDDDCDLDLADFAAFQRCFDLVVTPLDCMLADFDGNSIVDLDDYIQFAANFTGPR